MQHSLDDMTKLNECTRALDEFWETYSVAIDAISLLGRIAPGY